MSSFWGVEVKPGKPYTLTDSDSLGRLRLTQATLGEVAGKGEKGASGQKCVLQCSVENKDPVYLCALIPDESETCHLELEFDEDRVSFSVIGQRSIHLAGYYIPEDDLCDRDSGSDSLDSFKGSDDGLSESESDDVCTMITHDPNNVTDSEESEDNDDMVYNQNQHRGKSSVVIEEIQDDDKPAAGEVQKVSNKKHISKNGDKSQLQLAVRTPPAESMESEDEDGFPVSLAESKKNSDGGSKNSKERSNEDRKRKSEAISNRCDSSGDLKAENGGASKKKKKAKGKGTDVGNGKVNNEEKEVKQHDTPDDPVDTKQKKKKNKNTGSSEVVTDQQSAKKNQIQKDDKEVTAQEASNKKSKKQKTREANRGENQAETGITESGRKKPPLQTSGNGMIIEEIGMGKPDGKRASRGKKVSIRYIGKLKTGKIFDSTVGGRPFEFRLGVGEVIKGWDVGVDGMRIGDKRRLIIPPSMGYGNQKTGQIPPNSTLCFDVELVNVR